MVLEFLSPDLTGFLVVFLFVFALVYGLMVYVKIFEESKKAVAFIAIAIGLATAVYEPAAIFITQFIPYAAVVLVFLFFIVFVKKLFFQGKEGEKKDIVPAMIGIAVMLILINVFWDRLSGIIGFGTVSADSVLWMIGILLIILILYGSYSLWGKE